jgi:hypothetical protein
VLPWKERYTVGEEQAGECIVEVVVFGMMAA